MSTTRRNAVKLAVIGLTQTLALPHFARRSEAQTPQYLKLVYTDTPSHPAAKSMQRFADNVRKRTNGAILIQVYSLGELGSQQNLVTGLQTGIIELVAHAGAFVETLFPQWQLLDLPFLFPNSATAERVLDGPIGRQLLDLMPSKGIYGLAYGHWGWRVIDTVNRTLPAPADAQGLKVRVPPGPIFTAVWRALGTYPMSIDLAEIYLALSQRVIDAVDIPIVALPSNKVYEVLNTINVTNHQYNAGVLMASKQKFDTLPSTHQHSIRAASRDLTVDWRKTVASGTAAASAFLKAKGLTIAPVDSIAYRKATQSVYNDFRAMIGEELVDAALAAVRSG